LSRAENARTASPDGDMQIRFWAMDQMEKQPAERLFYFVPIRCDSWSAFLQLASIANLHIFLLPHVIRSALWIARATSTIRRFFRIQRDSTVLPPESVSEHHRDQLLGGPDSISVSP